MEKITNRRELSQMLCRGDSPDTEVRITLADLQRISDVALLNLRDQFAMAALASKAAEYVGYERTAEAAFAVAEAMLKVRDK